MREYKFRAWDKVNGMIYFDFDDLYYNQVTINHGVYDVPVMQWTGLTDSNGKEIYEGDILANKDVDNQFVRWNEHFARFGMSFSTGATTNIPSNCEVIGTIYENPELIEKA